MTEPEAVYRPLRPLRVWDLPVRLFHWSLVVLVLVSFTTAQIGGNAMQYHEWSGLTILTLVLFRVLWGFAGSTYARFGGFLRGPRSAVDYARTLLRGSQPAFHAGHNPLGGWMIVLLLASLLVQAGTGMFANDDIMMEGPLVKHVSKETSDLLTRIHHFNFNVLLALVIVHVGAALFYLRVKRENLILPLVTGAKHVPEGVSAQDRRGGPAWLALVLLAAATGAVWGILKI
jgi:cytochrome b